jgi:hypothetical protein
MTVFGAAENRRATRCSWTVLPPIGYLYVLFVGESTKASLEVSFDKGIWEFSPNS